MSVNFAMPIAHRTTTDYSAYNNELAVGRQFRQPLNSLPDASQFAPGVEIFIMNTATDPLPVDDISSIYSLLDGTLSWQGGSTSAPANQLMLGLAPNTAIENLLLEGPPKQMVYDNVDQATVQAALEAILNDAYTFASTHPNQNSWHPSMRTKVTVGNTHPSLKNYIQAHLPAGPTITQLIQRFLGQSSPAPLLEKIPVLAGQKLGNAAPYLASDPLPANAPFAMGSPGDPSRARRLTFKILNASGQVLDPLYYLYIFMQQMLLPPTSRPMNSLTAIIDSSGNLVHPLITLYPALINATGPTGWKEISGQTPLPLGYLADYHGYPKDSSVALLDWHYTNDSIFEAQAHVAGSPVPNLSGQSKSSTVSSLWGAYGGSLVTIARTLQMPCEVIIGLIGVESDPSLDERVIRLEPLKDNPKNNERQKVRNDALAAANEDAYDKAVGVHGTVSNVVQHTNGTTSFDIALDYSRRWTTAGILAERNTRILWNTERLPVTANSTSNVSTKNYTLTIKTPTSTTTPAEAWVLEGYSRPNPSLPPPGIPDPWSGSDLVHPGASTLTWDQLLTIVNATGGSNVSPGLLQTLITTAMSTINWLNKVAPNIYTALGIPAPPTTAGEMLNDWLLHGVHSLLVGAAYMRIEYNTQGTAFDLPLVGGAYNAGHLIKKAQRRWGLLYYGDYVEPAGPYFNAAATIFNSASFPPEFLPPVRFMR